MHDLTSALSVLRAIARASQGERAVPETLQRICDEIRNGFGFDRVAILQLLDDGQVVAPAAFAGVEEDALSLRLTLAESPLLEEAYRTQQLSFVADAQSETAFPSEIVERYNVRSAFALPLLSGGRSLGFLTGDRAGAPFALDRNEVDVLETVGALAATLLEKGSIADELRELDDARSRFVAFAAHELRTPIMTVYGMLSTVHERADELSQAQLIELRASAFAAADHLRRLADQLLDLSRLDAQPYDIEPQQHSIRRLIEQILDSIGPAAAEVRVCVADDLVLPIDASAIERIVTNLITNALLYGAPAVAVDAERRDRHFRLRVTDHGQGVPEELRNRFFERFTRGSTSTGKKGSGLGLAIARSYARAHGGELNYEPHRPHGARFELVLPLPG